VQLFDDLRPSSTPVWPVAPADEESHRLRVCLLHRGKIIGEDASAPFRIAGGPATPSKVDPRIVKISKESLYYSDRADAQFEIWKSNRVQQAKWLAGHTSGMKKDAQGNVLPQELERLAPDIRRQKAERDRKLNEAAETIRKNYEKALEEDGNNYRAAYGMAQLLHRIAPDRPDEAIGYLQKAVAIKPDHAAALNDLGASLIIEGDYDSAEEPLRRALAIEDTASYRYNLALALFHQKKTVEARKHFGEVLAKGGPAIRTGEVYYYIVSAFIQEGKMDEAKEHLHLYRDQIPAALRETLETSLRG
jgi:tetratricopeptide (TPR) repeat protein